MTSAQVKALQKQVGAKQDGIMGPNTIKALQKYLGFTGKDVDGKIGPKTRSMAIMKGIELDAPPPPKTAAANKATHKNAVTKSVATAQAKAITKKAAGGAPSPPAPSAAAPIAAALMAGMPPSMTDIAASVAAMDPLARATAAQQLNALAATPGATTDDLNAVVAGLANSITPQLANINAALAARSVAQDATSESNAALAQQTRDAAQQQKDTDDAERWAKLAGVQADILGQLRALAVQVVARDKYATRLYKAYGIPTS